MALSNTEYLTHYTGIVVAKQYQHKLFAKFYRADNAKKSPPRRHRPWSLYGKKVIIASGGAIIFKSTEGKGSTFGFTFPKK